MTRRYLNHNSEQLERLVVEAERSQDFEKLSSVRDELKMRSTRKAEALLAQVELSLKRLYAGPRPDPAPKGQMHLPVRPPEPRELAIPVFVPPPAPAPAPAPTAAAAPVPAATAAPALPVTSPQEAAKVLGVPLTARWEAVEAARANLVRAAAFPLAKGSEGDMDAARRVNGAYASLAASRRY